MQGGEVNLSDFVDNQPTKETNKQAQKEACVCTFFAFFFNLCMIMDTILIPVFMTLNFIKGQQLYREVELCTFFFRVFTITFDNLISFLMTLTLIQGHSGLQLPTLLRWLIKKER